jgi:tetratricopeptide (TPR) repeat protein
VTGDAINVAARLQQAAAPGEVLVGGATLELAGGAVEAVELEPLTVKGKSEPVPAFRLAGVGEAPKRRHAAGFVGRRAELSLLRAAWQRAVEASRCELVTIVGEPGVGKSRLVAEFVAGRGVVRGHCLSYGEGITYLPVVEAIRQLGATDDPALASLLGHAETGTTPEEIAAAVRRRLEAAAPLVVVFDDIQWGEETFLELVEKLGTAGAPLLVVCVARPELTERRPDWPVTLRLEPLARGEVEELLPEALAPALRERIVRAAGGNPLFLTEMVAMAGEGGEEVVVPGSLKALLTARLDQLGGPERGVLERGAVEGEVFHRGPLQALTGGQVSPQLGALVRKELIRPDSGLLPAEDAFRFCHLLVRDAAYEALPKRSRAELHERFAGWLEKHGAGLVERDELIGYHLQQAHRYLKELGAREGELAPLGERAAEHLAAAGRRAALCGDFHAVANLTERALALGIGDPEERVRLEIDLAKALWETGRIGESEALLSSTREAAAGLPERGLAERALVRSLTARLFSDPTLSSTEVVAAAERAIETFEALGDTLGLAEAEDLLGDALSREGRIEEGREARQRAVVHARAAGATGIVQRIVERTALGLCYGKGSVGDGLVRIGELISQNEDDRVLRAVLGRYLACSLAMAGRFDESRAELDASAAVLVEAEPTNTTWETRQRVAYAKELAGDAAGAEEELTALFEHFRDSRGEGSEGRALQMAARLALLQCDQGRWDEAAKTLVYGQEVDELVPVAGRPYVFLRLAARARVVAHRGNHDEALALGLTGADLADGWNWPNDDARVRLAYAEVLRAAGETDEADSEVHRALELYDRKGNIAAAERVRATTALPSTPRPSS